jgi:DNA-binding transcriptional LysR family regulator
VEFDDVRAFVSVADAGSVSLAARDLYVTQSAVTRRLQRLEASLGTPLVDRSTRPVVLTGAGQAALERCRRLLNEVREVHAAAANRNLPMGEVRIGVAHALTEFTLTEPVGQLGRKFPKVAPRLRTGWSRELLEGVRARGLDAAVILLPAGEPLPADLVGKQLGKERLVLIASRRVDHPPVRRIEDLAGVQWILNPEGCAARAALRSTLLRANIDMVVAVEAYNYELQLALVAQNRGLSLVPERIVKRSRLRTRLQALRMPGLNFPLTIWMVYFQPVSGFEAVIAELSGILIKSF